MAGIGDQPGFHERILKLPRNSYGNTDDIRVIAIIN